MTRHMLFIIFVLFLLLLYPFLWFIFTNRKLLFEKCLL